MNIEEAKRMILEAVASGRIAPTNIIFGDNVQHKVEAGGVVNNYYQSSERDEVISKVQVSEPDHERLLYIDAHEIKADGDVSVTKFEHMLESAVGGSASELAIFLKRYEKKGYLDFKGHSKKRIYEELRKFYPNKIGYSLRNFTLYY